MKSMERKIVEKAAEAINEKFADDPNVTVTATVAEHTRDEDGKFGNDYVVGFPVEPAAEAEPEAPPETPESIHYAAICELNERVQVKHSQWVEAKDECSGLKKDYDRLNGELLTLISRGPDAQRRLLFSEDRPAITSEAWRELPIAELGLPAGLNDKLEGESLGTLGALQDFWKAGKFLTDLNGIGSEKSALISDAFADYGVKHPEIFGEPGQAADDPAEETSADEADTEEDPADDE